MPLEDQKAWYSRIFDRLGETLSANGNSQQDTLQQLRSQTFNDIILSFTQGYDDHVMRFTRECITNGDSAEVWSFLIAQHDMHIRFGIGPPFVTIARKISRHIRQTKCGTRASPEPQVLVQPPPSPCSGPPTPCTVNAWLDGVESHILPDLLTPLPQQGVESQAPASHHMSTQMITETSPAQHLDRLPRAPSPAKISDSILPKALVPPHKHCKGARTRGKRTSSATHDRREGRGATLTRLGLRRSARLHENANKRRRQLY